MEKKEEKKEKSGGHVTKNTTRLFAPVLYSPGTCEAPPFCRRRRRRRRRRRQKVCLCRRSFPARLASSISWGRPRRRLRLWGEGDDDDVR